MNKECVKHFMLEQSHITSNGCQQYKLPIQKETSMHKESLQTLCAHNAHSVHSLMFIRLFMH